MCPFHGTRYKHGKSNNQTKKINVVKFRGLKNINIEFGSRLTVICGKNGTSKSTILGIVA
ncbi:AAA family ATPase [Symbiopectobacterium sp. RP]|uniref:AAA family ATPase n=1 Tax=Symbiopectobacterium sp. RP TaxID=3248553 RepID=UPI003D2BD390